MTVPLYNLTDTWNDGGTVFTGLKLNVTNTASAAGSKVIDLQVGTNSIFTVFSADGAIEFGNPAFTAGAPWGFGLVSFGLTFTRQGNACHIMGGNTLELGSDGSTPPYFGLNVTSGPSGVGFSDTRFYRDDAATFAQRNSTTAQAFRVYNTFTDATNYERGGFDWVTTANTFRIRSEAGGGGGTQRIIAVDGFGKAGAPANTDIPAGTYGFLRDTSGSHTYLIYNNAGTIQKIELV